MANDLKELRQQFAHDAQAWRPIRDEGTIDMRYVSGDPWTAEERRDRQKAGRPCLSADELGQYLNQVVNRCRSNKIGVKFTPVGNGANDKSAQFYQDKMREIEYRSRAQIAYTTAFENCVQRSYGFVQVDSRYLFPTSVNQDLFIDPLFNPNLITPDAAAQMPDLSDQMHCWKREKWPIDAYNANAVWKKYHLDGKGFDQALKDAPDWVTNDGVFVGERWRVILRSRKLLIVQFGEDDPIGVWEDDFEPGDDVQVLSERMADHRSVMKQVVNGLDILEETDWPGKYIPIVGCFGKVLYVEEGGTDTRLLMSMTRPGRDPQKMCAYLDSTEAELIGMTPKFPYFIYEGQLSALELQNLSESNLRPVPVVQVKPSIEGLPPGNGPLPFPQRNPYSPEIQSIEIARESWRRKVQAAVAGSPLPTSAQRRNEKSGVALKKIEELGEIGAYHFKDAYLGMIGMVGVIIEDLMDKVYDTPREVGIRHQDDTAEMIRINGEQDEVMTQGDHLVTVSAGASFDSEREAGSDFADALIASPIVQMVGPEKGPKLIAQAIKLKNIGVIGDEMAEIISPTPPKDGQPTPEQLQQALEQAKGEMQQMGQALQQAQQAAQTDAAKQQAVMAKAQLDAQAGLQKAQLDAQARMQQAQLEAEKDLLLQRMRDATSIAVAKIAASVKIGGQQDQAAFELQALGITQEHERALAAADAGHEELMAQIQQAHSLAMPADVPAVDEAAEATPIPEGWDA